MRIVINTAHQRFGGGVQVALSFINECIKFPEHEYHVWLGQGVGKSINKALFPNNFQFYDFDFGVIKFKTIRKIQITLKPLERKINPDIIISTTGPTYFHSKAPQIIGFNLPLYIYPESPFLIKLPRIKKVKLWIKKQVHFYYFKRDAIAYVTQTDDVNQRVRMALNTDNVFTVTNTCSDNYSQELISKPLLGPKKENEFRFLTLSSYYAHKDLEIIPKVVKALKNLGILNIRFVLTLQQRDFEQHIEPLPEIFNVGPVKPETCPSLYQECDGMFLPTLAECFSASYPEAMIMKKPIVTTNLGFAKSICDDAAVYFEPGNPDAAATAIETMVFNEGLKHRLVKNGINRLSHFDTANQRAYKYLEIAKQIVKGGRCPN